MVLVVSEHGFVCKIVYRVCMYTHFHFSGERTQSFHQILEGMHYSEKVKDHSTMWCFISSVSPLTLLSV